MFASACVSIRKYKCVCGALGNNIGIMAEGSAARNEMSNKRTNEGTNEVRTKERKNECGWMDWLWVHRGPIKRRAPVIIQANKGRSQ